MGIYVNCQTKPNTFLKKFKRIGFVSPSGSGENEGKAVEGIKEETSGSGTAGRGTCISGMAARW